MKMFSLLIVSAIFNIYCNAQSEENILLKGQSITTINKNTIVQNYGRTLAQLLNDQPGIIVNGAYQPTGTFISIYMQGTIGGRALILIDGIPVYDPSGIPEYFDVNMISLYELERIEIYHETQCSMLGNGALGGAINLITIKDNNNKKLNIVGLHSIGNQKTKNTQFQLWGNKNKWDYAVNYSHLKTAGFSVALDTTGKQGFDKDGFKGNILNSRITYHANKYFSINAFCLYSKYRAETDVESYIDAPDYYLTKTNWNTGSTFSYHKNKLLLQGSYQFTSANHFYKYDNYSWEDFIGKSHLIKTDIQYKTSSTIILLSGIDYRNDYMYSTYSDTIQTRYHYYPTINYWSIYGGVNYSTKDSLLSVNFIARAAHHDAYNMVYCYNISADYHIQKNVHLIGGIATGFKSPCLYQLYDTYGYANPSLVPDKTTDYHIGLYTTHARLKQKFNLYYNKLDDLITYDNSVSGFDNFNKQTTFGFQYELDWRMNKYFNLTTNYTYTEGTDYTPARENYNNITTYHYLYRRPKHVLNMGIRYTDAKLSIGVTGRYCGEYYDVASGDFDYIMNAFFLMNANASYSLNKCCKVFVNTQNLLNNTFYDVKGYNSIPFLFNAGISFQL